MSSTSNDTNPVKYTLIYNQCSEKLQIADKATEESAGFKEEGLWTRILVDLDSSEDVLLLWTLKVPESYMEDNPMMPNTVPCEQTLDSSAFKQAGDIVAQDRNDGKISEIWVQRCPGLHELCLDKSFSKVLKLAASRNYVFPDSMHQLDQKLDRRIAESLEGTQAEKSCYVCTCGRTS
ncbi:hypothetical protein MMC17_003255 [Xylographa soralifera]|nr:hypothetical protein [Xylographa soralifera]